MRHPLPRDLHSLALLALLADPEDRVALRCWCGFGSGTLNENGWARLRAHCEESGESPRDVLQELADGNLRLAHTNNVVARFNALRQREQQLGGIAGHALADALFSAAAGWSEPLRAIVNQKFQPNVAFYRL